MPSDLSEEGLRGTRVLGFYFSEECVPLSGVTFPSRFGIGSLLDLSGRCLEQLDPPITSWRGITFGAGSEEFSLPNLSSCLRIGVKQTAAATIFLLRQAQLLPESAAKVSLCCALQEGYAEDAACWRALWKSASGDTESYAPFIFWRVNMHVSTAKTNRRKSHDEHIVYFRKATRDRLENLLRVSQAHPWGLLPAGQRGEIDTIALARDLFFVADRSVDTSGLDLGGLQAQGIPEEFFSSSEARDYFMSFFWMASGVRWVEALRFVLSCAAPTRAVPRAGVFQPPDALYADCIFCDWDRLQKQAKETWEEWGSDRVKGTEGMRAGVWSVEDGVARGSIVCRDASCGPSGLNVSLLLFPDVRVRAGHLHLLGTSSDRDSYVSLQEKDIPWLKVLAEGLRWWAAELGFDDVEIFVRRKPSVPRFHLHAVSRGLYKKRNGDLSVRELLSSLGVQYSCHASVCGEGQRLAGEWRRVSYSCEVRRGHVRLGAYGILFTWKAGESAVAEGHNPEHPILITINILILMPAKSISQIDFLNQFFN